MLLKRKTAIVLISGAMLALTARAKLVNPAKQRPLTISTQKLTMTLEYEKRACISSLVVNGQMVVNSQDGIFTSVKVGDKTYSSLHLTSSPVLVKVKNTIRISGISYSAGSLRISENWTFDTGGPFIKWTIERSLSNAAKVEEAALPVFNFDQYKHLGRRLPGIWRTGMVLSF